jgi:putative SOS response-associated peptidase YedK
MCGRYGRWSDPSWVEEAFDEFSDTRIGPPGFPPTYNAAPQSVQPVVRLNRDTGRPELVAMKWGLVPYWAKDVKVGFSTFSARSEELADKPAFREALKSRRCLIPADAFYEWQKNGKERQPFAIAFKNRAPFCFAGLWDCWKSKDGTMLESFTIATTDPNEVVQPLHDRMPCILPRAEYRGWLDPGNPARPPVDLLKPVPGERMMRWAVDQRVGNVKNDDPSLIEPTA